jgi:hypothetical protein
VIPALVDKAQPNALQDGRIPAEGA